jgi:hypothetical protein
MQKPRIWQTYVAVGRPAPNPIDYPQTIRDKLDTVSAAGWELVAASRENDHHHLFFRAVAEQKPPFNWHDS